MKKIFLTIIFFLAAVSIYARDYSHPVGYYRLQSNHSITTTLLGLEYSFEGVVADRWTLIGRAGLVPTGFAAYCSPDATGFEGYMGLGASFEARYYSSIKRRTEMGKDTYNNSSDFYIHKAQSQYIRWRAGSKHHSGIRISQSNRKALGTGIHPWLPSGSEQ